MNTGGGVIDRIAAWGERQALRPVGFVFERVKREVDRVVDEKLPKPPWWLVPVIVSLSAVVTVYAHSRNQSEQSEPEPKVAAECGPTNDGGDDLDEALSRIGYQRPPMPDRWEVEEEYRELVIEAHPDQGGDAERFKELQNAWNTIDERQQLSGDSGD